MHGAIMDGLAQSGEPYTPASEEPVTLARYAAGLKVENFLEHVSIGASLPEMPVFLRPDRYVNAPLGSTYQTAYQGMPKFWRDVLEGRSPGA
jgi:hypothetical protein